MNKNTYFSNLPSDIVATSGRVHKNFAQLSRWTPPEKKERLYADWFADELENGGDPARIATNAIDEDDLGFFQYIMRPENAEKIYTEEQLKPRLDEGHDLFEELYGYALSKHRFDIASWIINNLGISLIDSLNAYIDDPIVASWLWDNNIDRDIDPGREISRATETGNFAVVDWMLSRNILPDEAQWQHFLHRFDGDDVRFVKMLDYLQSRGINPGYINQL